MNGVALIDVHKTSFGCPYFGTICPNVPAQNVESIMRKQGQDGKTYYPPQNPRRKALQSVGFSGPIFHTSAPLFPHEIPLLFPQSSGGASLGAIPCAAIREKGPAAYRARPGFRGGAIGEQGGLQRRIGRQDGLPEVAAIGTRPAFSQHITLAVQRQAAVILIIIGAQGFYQLVDRPLFLTGQLTGQSVTPCPLRRPVAPGNRTHSRCPASRGSRDRENQRRPWAAPGAHTGGSPASFFHRGCW
ncbi:hypothetical protein QCA_1698 [Clostridioides difficile CD40]|nr:hypothetical protein QCA_1698 [Clostridioides difficile CD40]